MYFRAGAGTGAGAGNWSWSWSRNKGEKVELENFGSTTLEHRVGTKYSIFSTKFREQFNFPFITFTYFTVL